MRWINHQLCTVTTVYAATGNGMATWLAWGGSVIPDAIEFLPGLFQHRGSSHWPYPYLGVLLLLVGAGAWTGDSLFFYLGWFVGGALLHLLQDGLSPGGIPLKGPFGKRSGLGWYVPFQGSETILVLILAGAGVGIAAARGGLSPEYLVGETERSFLLLEYFGRRLLGG